MTYPDSFAGLLPGSLYLTHAELGLQKMVAQEEWANDGSLDSRYDDWATGFDAGWNARLKTMEPLFHGLLVSLASATGVMFERRKGYGQTYRLTLECLDRVVETIRHLSEERAEQARAQFLSTLESTFEEGSHDGDSGS